MELLPNGRVQLAGTPYLAGAGLPLLPGVANVARHTGFSLAEAVRMASSNPAQLLGLPVAGKWFPGAPASFIRVRWGERPVLLEAVLNGKTLFSAEETA